MKKNNDLETFCKQNGKEHLLDEWDYKKNKGMFPNDISYGSGRKVWWKYAYDDPITGKHFDFEWQALVSNRAKGSGCPFLSGRAVWKGYNDLKSVCPELAKEWHPSKNGNITPEDVTSQSLKKVWWLYPYDDPITGNHFEFEWEATVVNRVNGRKCPFLSGQRVWRGFNDLATTNPELAVQWDYKKNDGLTPQEVTNGSQKKVWWILPYDDPVTGKHFAFEWQARIYSRTGGLGCPFLSGKATWKGFNDLATTHPELAKEWHPTRNGKLTPHDVSKGFDKSVWWLYPYDDPITGKHFDFEWKATVDARTTGKGCPFVKGKATWEGYNDLATTNPELAKEWHPTKNGKLKPSMIRAQSHKTIWWILPYDNPITGKHFDFEWQATPQHRIDGNGCPYLSGQRAWPGYNDLVTENPEVAKEFHPTKNFGLDKTRILSKSIRKVWWKCDVCGYVWRTRVLDRVKGQGCPNCTKS
jgi:hypothetical protein